MNSWPTVGMILRSLRYEHVQQRFSQWAAINTAVSRKRMESLEIRFTLMGNVGCRKIEEEHHGY